MIYVTSDLHGLALSDLKCLLEKVDFKDSDWLYILGDVIDRRGDGGVEILKWLLTQSNVQLILGNHEAMLLSCDFLFEEITEESIDNLSEKLELLDNYKNNGGDATLEALAKLRQEEPETVCDIIDYLRDAPICEAISVGDRDFLLVHAGLEGFSRNKSPEDYDYDEMLWTSPAIDEEYFDDIITVFGHTPTLYYGEEHNGRVLFNKTWIAIDVGVCHNNPPVLLRLDDLQVFKLECL